MFANVWMRRARIGSFCGHLWNIQGNTPILQMRGQVQSHRITCEVGWCILSSSFTLPWDFLRRRVGSLFPCPSDDSLDHLTPLTSGMWVVGKGCQLKARISRADSKEGLKSFLMKVKEESEKADLKLNIQKTKIMASGPIISQQIDGGNNGNSERLFSWAPKSLQMVTIALKLKDICSLEEKLW